MAVQDLTTLANAKQWLGITGNADDVLLTRLVTAASSFIQTWINRQIASASYSEIRNGTGGQRLMVANYPIISVSALTIGGVSIPASQQATPTSAQQSGYLYDDRLLYLIGYRFDRGFQNVSFSYQAGYTSTPLELEQACIELIGFKYREKDRIGQHSKSIGGEIVAYVTADMPESVLAVLDNYKKVVPV